MGANYTFYVKTIETHARTFLTLNILAIGRANIVVYRIVLLQKLVFSGAYPNLGFVIN